VHVRRALSVLAALSAATVAALVAVGAARGAPVPTFSYSPSSPLTGDLVTFKSPYDNPQSWDLDGDGNCDDASGTTARRSFDRAGSYTIKLCVGGPNPATFTRTITVQNRPPIASFTFTPTAPLTGDAIVFTSTSSDPDGPIMGLTWDLDNDGAFDDAGGVSASTAFAAPGTYTVRLLVIDRDGASAVATAVVPVAKRPPKLFAFSPVVRMVAFVRRAGTRVRELSIRAPEGSRTTVRCHGRGCAFRKLTRSNPVIRIRKLRRHPLRPHAVLTIRITKTDTIGRYTSFRIRSGKPPRRRDRCLLPGQSRPVACPAPAG
jgi:hypothetical protein